MGSGTGNKRSRKNKIPIVTNQFGADGRTAGQTAALVTVYGEGVQVVVGLTLEVALRWNRGRRGTGEEEEEREGKQSKLHFR